MSTATAPGQVTTTTMTAAQTPWAALAGLLLAVVWLYHRVLMGLASEWWKNDDYSHGLLLPFVLGYLIHQKKDYISTIPLRRSWLGLALIACSQAVHIVGFLGAEFFLQRVSFVMLLAGMVLFLLGWQHLWEGAFALLLIVLAIPLPSIVFNAVSFPLQLIASSWAESVLHLMNIPVLREGNILTLSSLTLSVAEACSGIRSLMSLITLGVMVAYFLPFRWWLRALFILSMVPIAIVANSFRVGGTGVLAHYYGEAAAQGFFHTFSGWLVFVFALAVVFLEVTLLMRFGKKFKLKAA